MRGAVRRPRAARGLKDLPPGQAARGRISALERAAVCALAQLAATLLAFTARYNQTVWPFNWKFTAADLDRLLYRISARQEPANLPQAA